MGVHILKLPSINVLCILEVPLDIFSSSYFYSLHEGTFGLVDYTNYEDMKYAVSSNNNIYIFL